MDCVVLFQLNSTRSPSKAFHPLSTMIATDLLYTVVQLYVFFLSSLLHSIVRLLGFSERVPFTVLGAAMGGAEVGLA
jgi:hypothetical protein